MHVQKHRPSTSTETWLKKHIEDILVQFQRSPARRLNFGSATPLEAWKRAMASDQLAHFGADRGYDFDVEHLL